MSSPIDPPSKKDFASDLGLKNCTPEQAAQIKKNFENTLLHQYQHMEDERKKREQERKELEQE